MARARINAAICDKGGLPLGRPAGDGAEGAEGRGERKDRREGLGNMRWCFFGNFPSAGYLRTKWVDVVAFCVAW